MHWPLVVKSRSRHLNYSLSLYPLFTTEWHALLHTATGRAAWIKAGNYKTFGLNFGRQHAISELRGDLIVAYGYGLGDCCKAWGGDGSAHSIFTWPNTYILGEQGWLVLSDQCTACKGLLWRRAPSPRHRANCHTVAPNTPLPWRMREAMAALETAQYTWISTLLMLMGTNDVTLKKWT